MSNWREKKIQITLVILVFLFAMGLRLNAPSADLPSHITFSGSILTDEGNQCHNSRSKALYDEWFPDDWRITNYNPVLPYLKYGIFKLFGVGLFQLRLISHIFAALSLIFFFLTLKSYMDPKYRWALVGTFLLAINFIYLMYNKIGTFETSITFWVILTLYFVEKYRSRRKAVFLVAAGASLFMTFVFKSIMVYFLPLPFVACALLMIFPPEKERQPFQECIKGIVLLVFGVLLVAVPWYFGHYLPNKEWIVSAPGKYMGNLMLPRSLDAVLQNFLTFPWKEQFYKIPIVWLGAVFYLPLFARRVLTRRADYTEIVYSFFFVSHTAVFFVLSYRPTRYFVPVIPAMIFMTVLLLKRFASGRQEERPQVRSVPGGLLFLFDTAWLTIAAYFCILPLISRYIVHLEIPALSLIYPAVCGALTAVFYIFSYFHKQWVWRKLNFKFIAIPITLLMLAASFYVNIAYYWDWHKTKTYTIRNISLELKDKLDNAYIAGMTAPVAVLENKHKALWLYPNFVNWDDKTFDKYPLTHALLGTDVSNEIVHFFHTWPERMERAELLHVYPIKDYFLHLYSFVDPYLRDAQFVEKENKTKKSKIHRSSGSKKNKSKPSVDAHFVLTAVNPSQKIVSVRVGRVYTLAAAAASDSDTSNSVDRNRFEVRKTKQMFELKPGENRLIVPIDVEFQEAADSVMFFLEYDQAFHRHHYRYEAENFPGRIGEVVADVSASNGHHRVFKAGESEAGYLAYGPAVPYARGFLVADFKINFEGLKTKIRPLCELDIYSHEDKKALTRMKIRPADIKKNTNGIYRLTLSLPATRTLEFRVKVEEWGNVEYDYMELTYYHGPLVKLK